MINCIIIDDEQHAIDLLTHHIRQTPFLNLLYSTTDPLEGLQLLHQHKVDLIFLDVQMPSMTGIDFIKTINGNARSYLLLPIANMPWKGLKMKLWTTCLNPYPSPASLKAPSGR